MRKQIAIIVCVLLCLPLLWTVFKVAGVLLEVRKSVKLANSIHDNLSKPEVYTPAALRLASLLQEGNRSEHEMFTNLVPRLPGDTFGQCWATFETNQVRVEFGGGFWHFGYELTRDIGNSNEKTNRWLLNLYTEGQTNKALWQFSTPIRQVDSDLKTN